MYLSYRRAVLSDFQECSFITQSRLRLCEKDFAELLSFQKELFDVGVSIPLVWEDLDQPQGKQRMAVALGFFATDEFIQGEKTNLPPFLPLRVLEKFRNGVRPFVTQDEFVKSQTDQGANLVSIHWAVDPKYGKEEYVKIIEFITQSYEKEMSQYRLKEYVEEVYGEYERDRLKAFGIELLRDYAEFSGKKYFDHPIGKGRPYLMGVVFKQMIEKNEKTGTAAGRIALLGPPKFNFRGNEQEVLKLALKGRTDEEIAKALNLSVVAVKKRWLLIYDKVLLKNPKLFNDNADGEAEKVKQKRRILMNLLQEHPEELWPNS